MVNLQVVMLSAPTSLASIMVIGPHHAAVTHAGDSSEVDQREHMVRQGSTGKCWSEFLCLKAPRCAKLGGLSRGMSSVDTPRSADPRRWAGAPRRRARGSPRGRTQNQRNSTETGSKRTRQQEPAF
jgi:hypothetical protein